MREATLLKIFRIRIEKEEANPYGFSFALDCSVQQSRLLSTTPATVALLNTSITVKLDLTIMVEKWQNNDLDEVKKKIP